MGATVTTGKAAAVFKRADTGENLYVLFERTYEKNCYPHHDRWSCICFGNYEQVLRRVFLHAAVCEGGMLQARNGWISPEGYIRDWQKHLKSPVSMPDKQIHLMDKRRDTYRSPIHDDAAMTKTLSILAGLGMEWMCEVLQSGGTVVFDLYRDVDAVLALYGENGPLSAWHAFEHNEIRSLRDDVGFKPVKTQTTEPQYRIWRMSKTEETLVGTVGAMPIRTMGWAYSAVGDFIINEVFPRELLHTGVATKLIANFRNACREAPVIGDATQVMVDCYAGPAVEPYHLDYVERLAAKLNLPQGAYKFACTFGDIVKTGALWELGQIRKDLVNWDIPDSHACSGPAMQIALL